jgi:hypothetical protein
LLDKTTPINSTQLISYNAGIFAINPATRMNKDTNGRKLGGAQL